MALELGQVNDNFRLVVLLMIHAPLAPFAR